MRVLAIGDIHGCAAALDALLASVDLQFGDTLVTLGDYVDKGLECKAVLDRLVALDARADIALVPILGNHDQMMLEARTGSRPEWLPTFGFRTLASYGHPFSAKTPPRRADLEQVVPAEHWAFLERCVDSYETAGHLFTHANVYPDHDLVDTPSYMLRWEKLHAKTSHPHQSGKTLICGHTAQKSGDPLNLGHAICIDTHAWAGGWLTCLDVHSGQLWRARQSGELDTGWISDY